MSVGICYAGILRSHSAGGTAPVRAWLPPAGCVRKRVRPIAAATVLFLVLCFQLSVRIGIIQEGYRLESFRNEALEQDQMLRQYRLQYAFLTSPRRLVQVAQERLGMVPSRPQQVRKLH